MCLRVARGVPVGMAESEGARCSVVAGASEGVRVGSAL